MVKPISEQELKAIEAVVFAHPEGIAIQDIQDELEEEIACRTLQYRLKHLVDEGRLAKEGSRRWAKYLLPAAAKRQAKAPEVSEEGLAGEVPLSKQAVKVQEHVRKPLRARKPVAVQAMAGRLEQVGERTSCCDGARPMNDLVRIAIAELVRFLARRVRVPLYLPRWPDTVWSASWATRWPMAVPERVEGPSLVHAWPARSPEYRACAPAVGEREKGHNL